LTKKDNTILGSLKVGSETLQRLVADFAVKLKDDAFKVHSFTEMFNITDIPGFNDRVSLQIYEALSKVADFLQVVDDFSSIIGDASETTRQLAGDHRSMCKYKDEYDDNYDKVLSRVKAYMISIELAAGLRPGE